MKKVRIFLISIFVLISFFNCEKNLNGVSTSEPDIVNKKIYLTKSDSGETIEANVGDTIEVKLSVMRSAGYVWETTEIDKSILEKLPVSPKENLEKLSKYSDDSLKVKIIVPVIIGGPGIQKCRYLIKNPGITSLGIDHLRPWLGISSSEGKFGITLVIY